ncbi:MAG: hypothetical protein JNJ57_03225, partial [Saprospiraceae bacterium]|nr:hypothetical protein [Saprospiraceae bacterium]
MNSRQQKLLVLTTAYFALLLVEGCGLLGPLCKCKEALPYIDYHVITAGAPDPNLLGRLAINIQPDSLEYVAQSQ